MEKINVYTLCVGRKRKIVGVYYYHHDLDQVMKNLVFGEDEETYIRVEQLPVEEYLYKNICDLSLEEIKAMTEKYGLSFQKFYDLWDSAVY